MWNIQVPYLISDRGRLESKLLSSLMNASVTESQNGWGWKRPLAVISSSFSSNTFWAWASAWKYMWSNCKILALIWMKPEWCGGLRAKKIFLWHFQCIFRIKKKKKKKILEWSPLSFGETSEFRDSHQNRLQKTKKSIEMQWMFMKEARLTPEEIKHLCLRTERLAVWVHMLPVFLSQGWGGAFPQMNCVPHVYNLLILPFCWRIAPKESQHSLSRVLEIAMWWILSLVSMEIVI